MAIKDKKIDPDSIDLEEFDDDLTEDSRPGDSGLLKAGLVFVAGVIIAALARGVKKSDYYD